MQPLAQQLQSNDTSVLDPSIVNLMAGVKQQESGGDYNKLGDKNSSGDYTAAGVGQWSNEINGVPQPLQPGQIPANFASDAKQYGLDPTDFSPENQNKVMYATLYTDKANGLSPEQALSKWNSGDPNKYLNEPSDPASGVGSVGAYNTAAYVKNALAYAQQYAQQKGTQGGPGVGGLPGAAPTTGTPPSDADSGPAPADPLTSSTLGKVVNFAFPALDDVINDVKGKSDKTGLQQLGDLGLSALWFLPFGDLAEGAGAGLKALGLGAKAAEAGGAIATGLGTGYAGDVAGNLAQGKTGASAATPGLGTVIGGGLGAAGVAAGGLYNKFYGEQNVVDGISKAYDDAIGATKSAGQNSSKFSARFAGTPGEFLANAGIVPETADVNGTLKFATGPDSNTYKTIQQRVDDLTALRNSALDKAGISFNTDDLRQQFLDKAENDPNIINKGEVDNVVGKVNPETGVREGGEINRLFDGYKAAYGDTINASQLGGIKTAMDGEVYKGLNPNFTKFAASTIGDGARTMLENASGEAGTPELKALNQIIAEHLQFLDSGSKKGILSRLDNQVVKGGRLGGYVARGIGGAIGATLGTNPVTKILAGVGGEEAGGLVSRWLQKMAAGGAVSGATLGRMATKDPEIVEQFLNYVGRSGEKIAPEVQPAQQSAGGLVRNVLNKTPGQKIANAIRG